MHCPTIEVIKPDDWHALDSAIERLGSYDWITFTSAATGVGSGSVTYRVPTVSLGLLFSRVGHVTIAGETLTVQQKGLLVNGS